MTNCFWAKALILASFLGLGACTSSPGVVPADMNLALRSVSVDQTAGVEANAKFRHELAESIKQELSRGGQGTEIARLAFEITGLDYQDQNSNRLFAKKSSLAARGTLISAPSGDRIGEFTLAVYAKGRGMDFQSDQGRQQIRDELIDLAARATVDKIFGSKRAKQVASNPATYQAEPWVDPQIRLAALRKKRLQAQQAQSIQSQNSAEEPAVITAPVLPVE